MDIVVSTYIAYLAICVPVVLFVGWTLHKNGRVFLVEIFEGNHALADSLNHLLVVGFYLAAIGFVSIMLRVGAHPKDTSGAIESLSTKIGLVLFVLGVVHLMNLLMLSVTRRKALLESIEARFRAGDFGTPEVNA